MPTRIAAVTFDFWNTLYSADGGAMDIVRPRRMKALRRILASAGVHPSEDDLQQAYLSGFDAYLEAWKHGVHFGAREQVLYFLEHFGVDATVLTGGSISRTVLEIENASFLAPLRLLPGVLETVPALAAAGYGLVIISDTSLTPERILREFLEKDGLLEYFSVLTFSDETGYPKPDRRMFEGTLAALRVRATRAARVGDTPRTDIAGAQAMGMIAIRCAGAVDHLEPPEADFVIQDRREISDILADLR